MLVMGSYVKHLREIASRNGVHGRTKHNRLRTELIPDRSADEQGSDDKTENDKRARRHAAPEIELCALGCAL